MRKIKKIVDLSWEFTAETPIYPGDPEPSVTVATTLENEGYNLSTLVMGTQTGTHVDAPYHFSNSGETIDNMELDFFLGEAVVVRVTDKKADEAITLEDIEPYKEEICEGKIVLFNTNWYKTRGTDEFFHHPYVNGDVAKYLVDNGRGSVTIRNIIQNTLFPLLKKVSKRVDIPFTWYDSNLNSFEFVKDESNKELASNKKVTLTEEQLKQLYDYPITGTELQVRKRTEIRDLFVLQCLVGQRVGDMQKFFNGDNEKDEEEDTISIIQQKTKARAIIPLTPLAKEIISKYQNTELKYYKPSNSNLNAELRIIAEEAGLNIPITFEDKDGKQVKPLFELVHTHTARHTFITIMCRRDIPKETIIIATGHEDTKMIDKVYSHLSNKDKAQKVSTAFKKKLDGDIFSMGKVETNSLNEAKPTNDATNNITFDTLLDTQFFASKINKAVELQSQVGHLKDGKLCSYDNEITSLISEIEKFSQSSTSDSDVAKQYVKQLSVWKLSDLHDCFREMIIKCVKIGISKDAIMQFINKALEIGLLDKERFTNIKEITTALLDKRNQG